MSKIDHQFLNGAAKSKSQDNFLNNSNQNQAKKQKDKNSEAQAKIADVFELPPTVVNNVLYQNIK